MGKFFNWIFKGVRVENRVPKTSADEAVVSLEQITEGTPVSGGADLGASQGCAGGDDTTGESALGVGDQQASAALLFERTENLGGAMSNFGGYQFTSGQAGNSQFGDMNNSFGANSSQFSSALSGATFGNRNILVVTPKTNTEVTQVVANLQHGDACIICLEGLATVDAQRRLDFLSGVICAMNGQIKRLNVNTYILTPNGIGVK